jgi:hypothetical protein
VSSRSFQPLNAIDPAQCPYDAVIAADRSEVLFAVGSADVELFSLSSIALQEILDRLAHDLRLDIETRRAGAGPVHTDENSVSL